jgi:hypothetical protein
MRQAAIFADAALRRVLEVIDRRRPAAQLRPMLAPCLVDSVLAIGRTRAGHDGAAVLRRMRLQPAGHRDPETAAEVFGTYGRRRRRDLDLYGGGERLGLALAGESTLLCRPVVRCVKADAEKRCAACGLVSANGCHR